MRRKKLTADQMNGYKGMSYSDALFRTAVKTLQGHGCKACGRPTVPGHVHHLISRRLDLLRWDHRNGILLCGDCHTQAHDKAWIKNHLRASPHYKALMALKMKPFKVYLLERKFSMREFQLRMNNANMEIIRHGN